MTEALTVYSLCLSDSGHRGMGDWDAYASRMAEHALNENGMHPDDGAAS